MDTSATDQAAEIGRKHGHNAATWVFDGNTSEETYRWFVAGIESGDPVVLDSVDPPGLPYEHYELYDQRDLAEDVSLDWDSPDQSLDDASEAYRLAADEAFWHEVERAARAALS